MWVGAGFQHKTHLEMVSAENWYRAGVYHVDVMSSPTQAETSYTSGQIFKGTLGLCTCEFDGTGSSYQGQPYRMSTVGLCCSDRS